MKTSKSIKIAYNNAIRDSREISNIADKLEKQRSSLEECLGNLQGGWKGDAGNLYRKKIEARIHEFDRIIKDLRLLSKSINKVAKDVQDADLKALEIAKQRTYGGNGGGGHF